MVTKRDLYKQDVDFSALALQSPEFNKFLKPNGQLDFSNPEAVKQLTKSLLKRDFGLVLDLPDDRLCPPVPNRFNYIVWIQDLLDSSSDDYKSWFDPNRDVVGLDIGTGAGCIYPLLGCVQRSRWRFAATEVDDKNMQYAQQNILANNLQSRIRPLKTTLTDPLIPLDSLGLQSIDFSICNPPFYSSGAELLESAARKSRPPHSACTGAEVEMVTPGGEVAFVGRMIEESIILKDRVQWYTSMVGKLTSVGSIVEKLRKSGVKNWAVTEFVQGGRTRRWAVAWSWRDLRPSWQASRGAGNVPKHLLPFPPEFEMSLNDAPTNARASRLQDILEPLGIHWEYLSRGGQGLGFADGNVWSRSARRSKKLEALETKSEARDEGSEYEPSPALGFKIVLHEFVGGLGTEVTVHWIKGNDPVLFESFCGMLKRQLQTSEQ